MEVLNPGKYAITLGGETREILVSLGLKTELLKIMTRGQLAFSKAKNSVALNEELATAIRDKQTEIDNLQKEEETEELVVAAQNELEELYQEAMAELALKQEENINQVINSKIEVTEQVFVEAIICLLAERDEKGHVIKELDKDDILWKPLYSEAQDELMDLLVAVADYITSSLKKISQIGEKVQSVSQSETQTS